MDNKNNEKLEKIKQALFQVTDNETIEEESEEKILKESKKQVLKGNFRKDLQLGR